MRSIYGCRNLTVVVYSPDAPCTYCNSTKLRLKQKGIEFSEVTADDEMIAQLKDEGYDAFPVVKVDLGDGASTSWSGFRFDHINRLAALYSEAA